MRYLSNAQLKTLVEDIETRPKYRNFHTRNARVVNGKRVARHLNAMKLDSSPGQTPVISGFLVAANYKGKPGNYEMDGYNWIEYSINDGELSIISAVGFGGFGGAYEYLEGIQPEILSRIGLEVNFPIKRLVGQLYLERRKTTEPSEVAIEEMLERGLPSEFVWKLIEWDLTLVTGTHQPSN